MNKEQIQELLNQVNEQILYFIKSIPVSQTQLNRVDFGSSIKFLENAVSMMQTLEKEVK